MFTEAFGLCGKNLCGALGKGSQRQVQVTLILSSIDSYRRTCVREESFWFLTQVFALSIEPTSVVHYYIVTLCATVYYSCMRPLTQ